MWMEVLHQLVSYFRPDVKNKYQLHDRGIKRRRGGGVK